MWTLKIFCHWNERNTFVWENFWREKLCAVRQARDVALEVRFSCWFQTILFAVLSSLLFRICVFFWEPHSTFSLIPKPACRIVPQKCTLIIKRAAVLIDLNLLTRITRRGWTWGVWRRPLVNVTFPMKVMTQDGRSTASSSKHAKPGNPRERLRGRTITDFSRQCRQRSASSKQVLASCEIPLLAFFINNHEMGIGTFHHYNRKQLSYSGAPGWA